MSDIEDERLAWHYTTRQNFMRIAGSGRLLPATEGVSAHETPVLWFSLNPVWEETACRMMKMADGSLRTLTRAETRQATGGLVRFGYPARLLIAWPKIARAAGIRTETAQALKAAAELMGANPDEWMGILEPISLGAPLLCVEVEKEGGWVRVARNP